MSENLSQFHFDVHPSVVLQLGDHMISDDVQALIELVKNAYDADSAYATVRVEPDYVMSGDESFYPGAIGRIIVEDGGFGMSYGDIQRGWLTVSNSIKREMKRAGELTPTKKRTPLGDKGLGRLGVQRLGQYVELFTCKEGTQSGYHVGIDWGLFQNVDMLTVIPIPSQRISKRVGTRVVISGLSNPEAWGEENTYRNVRRKLSQLIFPFGKERPFRVTGTVSGRSLDLETLADDVRETATIRYEFQFDGQALAIKGRYRLQYLQGRDSEEGENDDDTFARLIESDNGSSFFAYLAKEKRWASSLTHLGTNGWFVSTEIRRPFIHIDKVALVGRSVANPGPFNGEIDYFNLAQSALVGSSFDRVSQFSDFVKSQSGVRVFRDGFGIRPYGFDGYDWLGLGAQQTSGSSYYGLRPANTIGYVRLTGKGNSVLEELTNREGFVENAYYTNFVRLMTELVHHVRLVNTQLRRGYNDFRRHQLAGPSVGSRSSVDQMVSNMKGSAARARSLHSKVGQTKDTVTSLQQKTKEVRVAAKHAAPAGSAQSIRSEAEKRLSEFLPLLTEIEDALGQSKSTLDEVSASLVELQEIELVAVALEHDYRKIREQLVQFSELAGLGLTAEALSHELLRIAKDLNERTQGLAAYLRNKSLADMNILTYVEYVRGSISALRKEMSHLVPSMQYVRERRDRIGITDFLDELVEYYRERLKRKGIRVRVARESSDFTVKINRGKLTQVLDNLMLNAEYWVSEALRKDISSIGEISITIRDPYIRIADTGQGVDPSIEYSLFEPFITMKPPKEGRGLGLFIVRQLLDSVSCKISLLPNRNPSGRRYIFQLDLSGVCSNEP